MFAHKEISHRVRGPTRSKNARQLLVWVYRERCVHILCAFWTYYTQCLCWFCTAKASLRPPLHHAMCSLVKRYARVMRTWLLFATERKKKRSQNFNSVVSFGRPEWKKAIASFLETTEYATVTCKKYLYSYLQKVLVQIQIKSNYIYLWWNEERTACLVRNVQSKSVDFYPFHRHATTAQRNRSAHTACVTTLHSCYVTMRSFSANQKVRDFFHVNYYSWNHVIT